LGDVQYHMHFLPTLFALVLGYPLYQIAIKRPWLGLMILPCLFVKREVDIWVWTQFADTQLLPYLVRVVKLLTYCGYGMVAASFYGLYSLRLSSNDRTAMVVTFGLLAALLFLVKLVYAHKVILDGHWHYNFDPAYWADFIFPAVVFGLCLGLSHVRWPQALSNWAPYSFGIYLVHPIFLAMAEIWLRDTPLSPSALVGAKFGFALCGAIALTLVLSKTPGFGWTVGLGPLPCLRRHPISS